jgi:hypothetical protein
MNGHELQHFRIPEDLDRREREQWNAFRKVIALMGSKFTAHLTRPLSPKPLAELAIEADELTDRWDTHVPPQGLWPAPLPPRAGVTPWSGCER